jgi:hypothetical protein
VMHNTDVAEFVPATIQVTPAPMMPREMRYASTGVDHGVTPATLLLAVAPGAPRLPISAQGDIANVAIHVAIGNSRWPKINFVPGWIRRSLVGGSR